MRVFIASDHAGFKLKEKIKNQLKKERISFKDLGTDNEDRVDYPDFAFAVADAVSKDKNSKGILICGTGTGMVIASNKVKGVRAAVIYDDYSAQMARAHNNTNIACLRGRKFSTKKALKLIKIWLKTEFSKEPRHQIRIKKISDYENKINPACLP